MNLLICIVKLQANLTIFCVPASWAPSGKDSGGAPQLKGARWFSYDELKKCTSNFSERNEIGSGGYGKVVCLYFSLISHFSYSRTELNF